MNGNRFLLDTNILLYIIRKAYRLKLPDAIIAATALFLRATLVTNDKSFLSIKEIVEMKARELGYRMIRINIKIQDATLWGFAGVHW